MIGDRERRRQRAEEVHRAGRGADLVRDTAFWIAHGDREYRAEPKPISDSSDHDAHTAASPASDQRGGCQRCATSHVRRSATRL